jgi:quercetin dioxygenase-like cupin family protein
MAPIALVVAILFSAGLFLVTTPSSRAGVPYTFSYSEQGRGVAARSDTFTVTAGQSLVMQTHILEPGSRAPWHRHPDRSLVIMKRGRLSVWHSCSDKEIWRAGEAYVNRPVDMAINEGKETVELLVVYLNVPAVQPAGTLPVVPEIPPSDCPA